MSLRIAHVTATFPPYSGGTGNVCLHNARELARRGHHVTVITAAVPDAPAHEDRDGFTVCRLRPLFRVGNAPLLPGLIGALRGYDIAHVHCPFILGAELTALATALARIPLVVTYHSDLIGDGTWRDSIFRLATWSSRYAVLGIADRVLFVSPGHAATCDQRGLLKARPRHCALMPNGVDVLQFQPHADRGEMCLRFGIPADVRVIGFVGGLDRAHHYKGLEVLLTAVSRPELAGVHVLAVGDGDLKAQYVQLARTLALAGRVHFYGAADHTVLPALYRACDVVAVPSLVAESFGLVVVEALACGIAVVASDGPGVRGLLLPDRCGVVVPAGQPEALATALARVLSDPVECAAMGTRGRNSVVAHYAWPIIGEQLEQLYADVWNRRAADKPVAGGQP